MDELRYTSAYQMLPLHTLYTSFFFFFFSCPYIYFSSSDLALPLNVYTEWDGTVAMIPNIACTLILESTIYYDTYSPSMSMALNVC